MSKWDFSYNIGASISNIQRVTTVPQINPCKYSFL